MKLSFSIRGWQGYTWEDFCRAACEMRFSGIELHDIHGSAFSGKDSPFYKYNAAATVRNLFERGLSIPCLDSLADLSDASRCEENRREILDCVETARNLHVPYVRIHATGPRGSDVTPVTDCIASVLDAAGQAGVTLLLETVAVFADTARLRDVLNRFASDSLAALWDMHHPWCDCGEDPETTITNLGAYIRHVHIKDSVADGESRRYCLIGEGDLPIADMDLAGIAHLAAVRSRIPFLHFFDGFRTSHEIAKVEEMPYEELAALLDRDALNEWRAGALSPEHPTLRATVQNPDIFFQVREANNGFYDALPDIVEEYMTKISAFTGREYHLFNYYGAPDAGRVVIAMGSVAITTRPASGAP